MLKYGALPVELKPQAVQTVSATLGKDSLRAGLIAGSSASLLVLLFMILYYRSARPSGRGRPVPGVGCLLWTSIS